MGYAVELSFDVMKTAGISKKQDVLTSLASQHNCTCTYSSFEAEGIGRKVYRSDSLHVVMFDDEGHVDMLEFVKEVRQNKIAYVECIYRDDCSCDLLYASPKYLKMLDKPTSLRVRRNIRERSKSEDFVAEVLSAVRVNT